jgi:hypothetical protein
VGIWLGNGVGLPTIYVGAIDGLKVGIAVGEPDEGLNVGNELG